VLRLFLGISLPSYWQEQLFSAISGAKRTVSDARWVPAKNMHITLKFLGDCSEELPERILAALSDSLSTRKSFTFKLGSLGGFPSLGRTRVFWMGVDEGYDQMVDLAGRIEESLVPLGFEEERKKFHPHVTLARLKKPQDLREIISNQKLQGFEESLIEAGSVVLYKSTLTPRGAIYAKIGETFLK
jgi:2'-5' RNA ligase